MIASVIVDIKVKNVNKPFSYLVPEYLEAVIERGMRVKVPFGSREVLGFVIGLAADKDIDKLKPITELLDITPSLTEELLTLSNEMADATASYLIQCIQAMLPAAIKARYNKNLIMKSSVPGLEKYFTNQNVCVFDKIEKTDFGLVKKAISEGKLDLVYEVKDKVNIRYETYVTLKALDAHVTGKKQQEAISALKSSGRMKKSELNISASTYHSLLAKGIIAEDHEESYREPYESDYGLGIRHEMNEDQKRAYVAIIDSVHAKKDDVFLLHGITGSGKTEVYLQVIEDTIKGGREAVMLVPEISLTPQIVRLFKGRFGNQVAVLHSGLSLGEKYDEWRKIRKGEVKVAVGARSAVFAPFTDIGVMIIDEEHESSYKQEDMPKYHAAEIAKMRARYHHAPVVLGSATPSLESYARAVKNVYKLLELPERATKTALPETEIVNMADEYKSGNLSIISGRLKTEITERLLKHEQIILLMNRRGYDNFILCRGCGYTVMCPNCDITLTYHKTGGKLKCHYCGYETTPLTVCPNCGSAHLQGFGFGTQKVEEELLGTFPEARVIRMDYDTTGNKGDHEKLLAAFRNKQADILLGTQMIAKGLDFEDVTLVGVLSADTTLKLPDFRAGEKTFQLIMQVSGRAGRHKGDSRVIIQTYNPDHYAVVLAAKSNYIAFFNQEMKMRHLAKYVPYYFMTSIVVSDEIFSEALKEADRVFQYLKSSLSAEAIILGPVVPQIKRINNIYSSQIIIKYRKEPSLKQTLENLLISCQNKKVNLTIDMYPYFLL